MTESKYNTLKNAINELSEIYGNEAGVQAIAEIANVVDKYEDKEAQAKPAQAKPALTKQEILSEKNATKRLALINDNMELFKGGN